MGIFREQGNGRMGTMIRHLKFVFGLHNTLGFRGWRGSPSDHERPTRRGLYGTPEMNSMVIWYIIGMIIGSCVTLTAVSAVNRDSGGVFCVDKWKK